MIVMLSSMSSPQTYFPGWAGEINDKVLHTLEYAILAILCYRAFLHASGPWLAEFAGSLAIIAAILFGVSDEFHQSFVRLREADPWDLVADAAGSLMGVTCWKKISPRLRMIQTP
jgi:VanZ family protein